MNQLKERWWNVLAYTVWPVYLAMEGLRQWSFEHLPRNPPGKAYLFLQQHDWCQGYYARAADGEWVEPHDERAVAWDAEGAMMAVYGQGWRFVQARRRVLRSLDVPFLGIWSDRPETTKEAVVGVLRRMDV